MFMHRGRLRRNTQACALPFRSVLDSRISTGMLCRGKNVVMQRRFEYYHVGVRSRIHDGVRYPQATDALLLLLPWKPNQSTPQDMTTAHGFLSVCTVASPCLLPHACNSEV